MIVVIILFLVGENVYTLVCRPWNNGQLLKVATYTHTCTCRYMYSVCIYMYALLFCSQLVDSSGLIPLPQITLSSGMKMNISISDIYRYVMPDIHVPCSFLKKCLSNRAKKKSHYEMIGVSKNCKLWILRKTLRYMNNAQ